MSNELLRTFVLSFTDNLNELLIKMDEIGIKQITVFDKNNLIHCVANSDQIKRIGAPFKVSQIERRDDRLLPLDLAM